jgi:hypothetical protein
MSENRLRSSVGLDQVESYIYRSYILAVVERHGEEPEAGRTNAEEALHLQLGFASVLWSFASLGLGSGALEGVL